MPNKRPTLADVKDWRDVTRDVHEGAVKVEAGTLNYQGVDWSEGAWRITDKHTGKRKVFYGETAWSDAERLADDLMFEARKREWSR
jgi:hypothetical protein